MNRAILLTPPGVGAIAVVRLHGEGVGQFLLSHFSKTIGTGPRHGELCDGERIIDDPVIVRIDPLTADINLHGGTWIVQTTLELARRSGFEIVPQHLPLPDFAVDADSDFEREMLTHLPMAKTREAIELLLDQPALWEVLKANPTAQMLERALQTRSLHWHLHPPRVAIVGPANAGKSTLANQLFGQQRSITADVPGTTRDWVGETANIDGLAVTLLDTPGIRASDDAIETEAIHRAGKVIEQADLIVLVLDSTRPAECELIERFPDAMRVMNKVDAAPAWDASAIETIARTGRGVDQLRRLIRDRFIDAPTAECWTQRQRKIVQQALVDPRRLLGL